VPAFDFNWQTPYRLATPQKVPKGSFLKCLAHFDNSDKNPYNPDPAATVRWGDQTWDEMMIGYVDYVIDPDEGALLERHRPRAEPAAGECDPARGAPRPSPQKPRGSRARSRGPVRDGLRLALAVLAGTRPWRPCFGARKSPRRPELLLVEGLAVLLRLRLRAAFWSGVSESRSRRAGLPGR
jgi:hypothetical protein